MSSMQQMITILLENIKNGKYPPEFLDNQQQLAEKIGSDLGCDASKAMSILGYLLKFQYVKIDPDKGIILIKE
jgi:hypothetical protein